MKKKTAFYSVLLATLAMAVSYFSTNLNVAVSGEREVLKYWSFVSNLFPTNSKNTVPDEVLFINISSDRQLVDRTDEYGIPVGNVAITDRKKLDELLTLIKSAGNYRYVLLDVFFEEGYRSDSDSSLFRNIASMDRVVIPRHVDGKLADSLLMLKSAYSDYTTSLNEDNITKYPLLDREGKEYSIPLKMYSDLTGRTLRRLGPLYMEKAALSRRAVFPKMYVQIDSPTNADGEKTYLNMGSDILDYRDQIDWSGVLKDKIVVIGSFTDDDIHLTYAGDLPGCVINYNVFTSLMRGQHKIPLVLILVYFLIFFAMSYLLLHGVSGTAQSWGWVWAKLFVLYSIVLTIVCIVVFTVWGQAHDIFITSTLFSMIDTFHKKITKKESHA